MYLHEFNDSIRRKEQPTSIWNVFVDAGIHYFLWKQTEDGKYKIVSDCTVSSDYREITFKNDITTAYDKDDGVVNKLTLEDITTDTWKLGIYFTCKQSITEDNIKDIISDETICFDEVGYIIHLDMTTMELMPWIDITNDYYSNVLFKATSDFTFSVYSTCNGRGIAWDDEYDEPLASVCTLIKREVSFNHTNSEFTVNEESINVVNREDLYNTIIKRDPDLTHWIRHDD